MKHKYILFCMTLSIFLALSGCKKNVNSKEDVTYNQNLNNDDHVDESSDNSNNNSKTNNETLDNSSQSIDDTNQDKLNDQPNILDCSNKDAYFLSSNSDFYEKVSCNPIDQTYVIDEEAAPLEIWQSALKKCKAWNQQIDFTSLKLESLLSKSDYESLQNAISLWHEYYQEEVEQNRELYGANGLIAGSMYTAISADVLIEKCKLTSFTLLSYEYALSNNVTFEENATTTNNDSNYSVSPQSFCIENSSDFEGMLSSYAINEKNINELEELIHETANKIEDKFGHDFLKHTNKYVSFIDTLYIIENDISKDSNLSLTLKQNRLKLYAIELINILYMIEV